MTVRVEDILAEVGAHDDAVSSVVQIDDNRWIMSFDAEDVSIERDAQTERLVFSTVIGRPYASRRGRIFEALLLYGFLWRETGGVRMALDAETDDIVQLVDIPLAQLDHKLVARVAINLLRRGRTWREFVIAPPAGDENENVAALPSDFGSEHILIRG